MNEHTSRRDVLRLAAVGGTVALAGGISPSAFGATNERCDADKAADRAADRIVRSIQRPRIPRRDFVITDYGSIQAAIRAASAKGGGRVVVPAGTWPTGPIRLASRIDLHLAEGATLLFDTDPRAYLPTVHSRWQGIELMNYSPLIYAYGEHDISVTGKGVLDGQASAANWWAWKKPGDADFPVFEASVNAGLPVEQRDGTKYHFRPAFIEPYHCERVLIEGVTLRNSPFWHLHPTLCHDVTIRDVTVASTGPNTDGCDPESCDGVLLDRMSFDVGDDCVAIKSGRDADGRRVDVPCQHVVIQNSTFAAGHGGITIGSEMTGGVREVYARDLAMTSTSLQAGHRLKTNSVRGGFIEASHVWRVDVSAIGGPLLLIDYNYGEGNTGSYPPVVTDINLSHWTVAGAMQGWDIKGYPNDPIGTVRLRDVTIAGALTTPNVAANVSDLLLTDVVIDGVPQ
ncbi:glycoside hydrolase family 28 protein [Catenulispora rubra]|uniref:glycoside hydrolase family 28 protein n=1 Tax=Catenulispora rubra TaxID=280293 RepID=UPI0018920D85|nr:glycoside hydrolase family 28 protein [Catenulispora rubra]